MAKDRRDHLVDCAMRLFQQGGFHATGVDRILKEAGVAKMTLYGHFRSKDELILAALRRYDEQFRNAFMREVERRATDPRNGLLAAFDVVGDEVTDKEFRGCMFAHAAAEYHDPASPIHAAAAEHKRLMLDYLSRLARDAGARDPDCLARQLWLLLEGVLSAAHVASARDAATDAKSAAHTLIDSALSGPD